MASTRRVFVSHSHQDQDFCLRLITDLRHDLGGDDTVWYDANGGLHAGDAWWRTIVQEIAAREVFIVALSPAAVASKWVEDEIDLAWQQKNSTVGKTIIPIIYRDCVVRADLKTRHIISLLDWGAYPALYAELLATLGVAASERHKQPSLGSTPCAPTVCTYIRGTIYTRASALCRWSGGHRGQAENEVA